MADPTPDFSLSRLSEDELLALAEAYRRSAAERATQLSEGARTARLTRAQVTKEAWRGRSQLWRRRFARGPRAVGGRARRLAGRVVRRLMRLMRPARDATCPHCGGRLT